MPIPKDKLDLIIAGLEIIGGLLVSFLGVRLLEQLGPGICFNCACRVLTSFLILIGQLDSSCQFREMTLITIIVAIVLAVISMFFDKLKIILMLQFAGDFLFKQFLLISLISNMRLKLGIKVVVIVAILLFGGIFGCRLNFSKQSKKTAFLCGIVGSIDVFYGALTFYKYFFFNHITFRVYIKFLIGAAVLAFSGYLVQICYFIKHMDRKNMKTIKIQL
jgi:hypothetical protein